MHMNCILQDLFKESPPNRIRQYLGEYLRAPNMGAWAIPEKILQNTVHCWYLVNRTPTQKLWPNLIFARFSHSQWGYLPKIRLGHIFWLEGPIHLRPTRLNCILQDLFRDTPLDHIARAQIFPPKYAYLAYLAIFGIFGRVIWRAKYGQVGCPWKDLAKCSSDALVLGQ